MAALLYLLCFWFVSPALVAEWGPYLTADGEDEYGHLTGYVQGIAHERPEGTAVLLFGASTFREAFSSEAHMEEALAEQGVPAPRVFRFLTGALRPWEMGCIAENVPPVERGVAVLEIAPVQLHWGREDLVHSIERPHMAIACDFTLEQARRLGLPAEARSGNYFLDNIAFFVARPQILVNLLRGPRPVIPHQSELWRPPTEAEFEQAVLGAARWMEDYEENHAFNLGIYGAVIDELRARGVEPVLLEATRNPRTTERIFSSEEARARLEAYRAEVAALAERAGVRYWRIEEGLDLRPEHFIDHVHISDPEARGRYTAALAHRIAAVLDEESPAGGEEAE